MYAIQVSNLQKEYKNGVQAVDDLNISVERGEIFSLLGKNGAGKSTLINILTTYLKPSKGDIMILGKDIYKDPAIIRSQIACVAQRISIDTHLSLKDNMLFQSRLYKIPKAEARKRMDLLISAFELEQYLQYPVSLYSGGIKRRLDIALNMMSNPEILFLDEPTVGMDVQSRIIMWEMIKKIRNEFGTTIFLTTHYLEEADSLSDTICIMKEGKAVIQGTSCELREYIKQDALQVKFLTDKSAKENMHFITKYNPDSKANIRNNCIIITSEDSHTDLENYSRYFINNHIPFIGIEVMQPTLEDVFLRLTDQKKQEDCI